MLDKRSALLWEKPSKDEYALIIAWWCWSAVWVHHLGAFPRARVRSLRAFCLCSSLCFICVLSLSWSKWARPEETSVLFCCVSSLFQIISYVPKVSPLVFTRASHLPSASVLSLKLVLKGKKLAFLSLILLTFRGLSPKWDSDWVRIEPPIVFQGLYYAN